MQTDASEFISAMAFVVDFFYGVRLGGVAGLCSADKGDLWMRDNMSEA